MASKGRGHLEEPPEAHAGTRTDAIRLTIRYQEMKYPWTKGVQSEVWGCAEALSVFHPAFILDPPGGWTSGVSCRCVTISSLVPVPVGCCHLGHSRCCHGPTSFVGTRISSLPVNGTVPKWLNPECLLSRLKGNMSKWLRMGRVNVGTVRRCQRQVRRHSRD